VLEIKLDAYLKKHNVTEKEILNFRIEEFYFNDGMFYMKVECKCMDSFNDEMWFNVEVPLGKVVFEDK